MHPLKRLIQYASGHDARVRRATAYSVLNKFFDLGPPFLIGMAVDVVVRDDTSIVATVFGVTDQLQQLFVLAALNALVWILESAFEYLYQVEWRNLAQDIQHHARLDAWRHVQSLEMKWFEDRSTGGLMAILNDDVNQPRLRDRSGLGSPAEPERRLRDRQHRVGQYRWGRCPSLCPPIRGSRRTGARGRPRPTDDVRAEAAAQAEAWARTRAAGRRRTF